MYSFIKRREQNQEGRIINGQNLNEYLETLQPAPTLSFNLHAWFLL